MKTTFGILAPSPHQSAGSRALSCPGGGAAMARPAHLRHGTESANRARSLQTRADRIVVTKHRIYTTSFASVYPHYVAKAERKGRTKAEVDEIILWLTGFSPEDLASQLAKKSDFETFFAEAPRPNPARAEIKGVVCGVRVEEVAEPLMREIRYLDKLVDELAKGKAMQKILRG
jgi:hypothetical protein